MPKLTFILTLLLMLIACNSIGTKQKGEGLVTAMDEYIAALRWGRFDSAIEYHLNKDETLQEIDTSQLEYIKVTEHSIKKKTINEDMDEALVEVRMEYYHSQYATVKKIIFKQVWWLHEKSRKWHLSSDFPKF
jgi:hypothetical protein